MYNIQKNDRLCYIILITYFLGPAELMSVNQLFTLPFNKPILNGIQVLKTQVNSFAIRLDELS